MFSRFLKQACKRLAPLLLQLRAAGVPTHFLEHGIDAHVLGIAGGEGHGESRPRPSSITVSSHSKCIQWYNTYDRTLSQICVRMCVEYKVTKHEMT